ncbi:DUF4350 domain-containing protein [Curtobacterium sp. MCBA15_012]|uniref:DUF4350 domain-containing protein n=1 Tax=Curtobacterium sp. MCBA15_012 TaxID=1898738 RepID=UPI0008DCC666|nr:DUF4350 domain-containing protein [Curtobacterium sp. MCBA15_012]WIA98990.1 hypothetical protein QOL15_10595 [Curtobacterium sp. MCBA15_012]
MSARTATPAPTGTPATPTPAGRAARTRHVGAWVLVVAVALVLAVLTAVVQSTTPPGRDPLDPRSATASGSMALVRVLEQRGTRVDVVRDADRVGDGTVFVDDVSGVLDPDVARRLVHRAEHVVLVSGDPRVLDAVGLPLEPAARPGDGDTVSTARCGIPAAATAGEVSTDGTAYVRTPGGPGSDGADAGTTGSLELCAPSGTGEDRAWGLARTDTPAGDVTLVGTTAAFRNDTVTTAGNAALALGLLGQGGGTDGTDTLTWYVPTAGSPDAAPTLGSLAPPWVPGLLGLLGLVVVAAAVWRGRRLGPLVVERLPVVVRAAETTEGRARLYARTRDRTHALDTLRVAALRRTARRLGLPRSAHVDEVVRAAARATGRPDHDVGRVLVGGPAGDDRRLVDAVAALDALEAAVRAATEGRTPGTGPGTGPTATTTIDTATATATGRDTAHDDHRRGARP